MWGSLFVSSVRLGGGWQAIPLSPFYPEKADVLLGYGAAVVAIPSAAGAGPAARKWRDPHGDRAFGAI
jgi:hypothetical protein